MRGKFPCPTHSFVRQTQKTVGTTKTKYVYSGSQLLEEYNGTTNALLRRYVYAGPHEPIFQIASNGTVTYLHHDHLGSVIAQANASGVVGNKYKYSPFGEATSMTGTTIGYTGQRWDNETGLYHYKARYYRPGINRFLQTDPIGYQEDLHLYAYVKNDPMNATDPDGMQDAPVTSSLQRDPHFRYQYDKSEIPWFLDFRPRVNAYDGEVARGLPADSLSGAFNAGARGATSKAIKDGLIVRLRHYTSNKGLTGIQQSNVIRAGDKGRVFNESANRRPLSRADAESTYGLKPGHGRNYVEYNAKLKEVLVEKNPFTRATEHNIKGDVDLAGRVASFTKRK